MCRHRIKLGSSRANAGPQLNHRIGDISHATALALQDVPGGRIAVAAVVRLFWVRLRCARHALHSGLRDAKSPNGLQTTTNPPPAVMREITGSETTMSLYEKISDEVVRRQQHYLLHQLRSTHVLAAARDHRIRTTDCARGFPNQPSVPLLFALLTRLSKPGCQLFFIPYRHAERAARMHLTPGRVR